VAQVLEHCLASVRPEFATKKKKQTKKPKIFDINLTKFKTDFFWLINVLE
jgi:hypothetical protein